jgi:hypothetical protein
MYFHVFLRFAIVQQAKADLRFPIILSDSEFGDETHCQSSFDAKTSQ